MYMYLRYRFIISFSFVGTYFIWYLTLQRRRATVRLVLPAPSAFDSNCYRRVLTRTCSIITI